MVKLPTIQPRGAMTRGPQSSVSAAEIANPFQQIADALGTMGKAFEAKEMEDASNEGQNAVFRNPDGSLGVDLKSNFSATGRSYNRAAQQGYAARLSGDIRARGSALAEESKGNIDAFNSSWKGFRDQTLTAVPKDFRGAVTTMLDTEGPRFALGVSERKRKSDLQEFEGNIKSEIQLLDDDMSALARSGGTGTETYREKQGQLKTLWDELAQNPDFTVGDKEAAISMKRMESRHMSEAMLGTVEKTLETGGVAKAKEIANRIITDDTLSLQPSERRQYANLANERINSYAAQRKADLRPVQDQAKVVQERMKTGVGLDDDDVDIYARQLASGGDMAGALELYQSRAVAKTLQSFRLSDNTQQIATAEKAIRGGGGNVVDRIINVESGGNASAQNPNSSAGGAGQFINSTWLSMIQKYRPDITAGKSSKEILALKMDGGLSREMTTRYTEENTEFLRNQGIQTTPGNVYLAHFLGPRGAAQLLKADPSASVESIVGSDAVNANSFLKGKSVADVANWAAKKMGSASGYVAPEVIKEYRQEVTSDAKDLFASIKAGSDKGFTPAVSDLNLLTRQLSVVDDQDLRREVADYFTSQSAIASIQGMAPGDVESLMSQLRDDASDGATVAQQQIMTGMQAAQDARASALEKDPIGYAVNRGLTTAPPPLDLNSPDTWGATFQSLQRGVDVLQARGEVGNIPALRPEMLGQVTRMLETAPPEQSMQLLSSMASSMRPETYKATLGKLYASGQGRAAATAGALAPLNPAAAEGILRGQLLLKENPLLAPKKTDDNRVQVDEMLPTSAMAPGYETSRQFLLESATARYADLAQQAGDTSGELNPERMQQAVTEVTGGLVDMNGYQVIAPTYGMKQDEFDKRIEAVGDADLAGAITSTGQRVTADDLRSQGRLRAIADGRYVLEFGRPESPSYVMRQPSPGTYRQSTFVLDLRNR